MAKLPPERIVEFAPRIAHLEVSEPLVGCWRFHAETGGNPSAVRNLIGWASELRHFRLRLPRPASGQIVALGYRQTPATWGSLRPVLAELQHRGQPAFLVTGPGSKKIVNEGLHRGTVDLYQLVASAGPVRRTRNLLRARTFARGLGEVVPMEYLSGAERWIEVALTLRDVTAEWVVGAGCVVADSDIEAPRMGFIEGARIAGVETAVLQHGFFGPHQFPLHADRFLCWGKYFSKLAVGFGVDPSRVQAVGCARWDDLPGMRNDPKDPSIEAAMGWSGSAPRVLVISNAHGAPLYPDHYEAYFETLGVLLDSSAAVTIKLHPAESDLGLYKRRLSPAQIDRLRVVPAEVSLHDAIRHADSAYNVFSAAALEAALLGVPVLFEDGANAVSGKLCDLPDHGGGVWCGGEGAVALAIEISQSQQRRDEILHRQDEYLDIAFANLGRSTTAIVDEISA